MSFLLPNPCVGALNSSSGLLSRRKTKDTCVLRFSGEFLHPSDDITEWYNDRRDKWFNTILYCKERGGLYHEFILILLRAGRGDTIESYCRLERIGDPNHRFQTLFIDGTTTVDLIQDRPDSSDLTKDSDVIADITFPITFDLRDVLAICYGISQHRRAKRYTLQKYNCYFFSWTIIMVLARACVNWDAGSSSLVERVQNIQDGIMASIHKQQSRRCHSIAYILSNNTSTSHEAQEEHPLDQTLRSKVYSADFSASVVKGFYGLLWGHRLWYAARDIMHDALCEAAVITIHLLDCEEHQNGAVDISDIQNNQNHNLEHAVRKIAEKTAVDIFDTTIAMLCRNTDHYFRDVSLVKEKIGHKAWYKCFGRGIWRAPALDFNWLDSEDDPEEGPELADSPPAQQLKKLSICDCLLIPPAAILTLCLRSVLAGGASACVSTQRALLKYRVGRRINKNNLPGMVRCIGSAIGHTIRVVPKAWAASKLYQYELTREYALKHGFAQNFPKMPFFFNTEEVDEAKRIATGSEGWSKALEMLNTGVQEAIVANKGFHFGAFRRSLSTVLRSLSSSFNFFPTSSEDVLLFWWAGILLHQFLGGVVKVAHNALEELVKQASAERVFHAVGIDESSETHQVDAPGPRSCGEIPGLMARLLILRQNENEAQNLGYQLRSYEDIQGFIKLRIARLSKWEIGISLASPLEQVRSTEEAERCQSEIEKTMGDIWYSCRELMVNQGSETSGRS